MNKTILAALITTISFSAHAQSKKFKLEPETKTFATISAEELQPDVVHFQYTDNPTRFDKWITTPEAEFLNLFEGFKERKVKKTRAASERVTEHLVMFVARAKAVINKAPNALNLKSIASVEFIKGLNPEIRHRAISPMEIMPIVAAKPVGLGEPENDHPNFKAMCNQGEVSFKRPAKEQDLADTNRPGQSWCANTERSICVESCYVFTANYQRGMNTYNSTYGRINGDEKDLGIASQSEIRYFVSEAEWGKRQSASSLTGIKTPVRGIFEQNIFYFNQLNQYGKMIAIFQEHPSDSTKTIVTSLAVFGIQASTFERNAPFPIRLILMGRGGGLLNTSTGITAGLPVFGRDTAVQFMELLEK